MFDLRLWKKHVSIFRIFLGSYLAYHFITLFPYAFEIFGHNQMLTSIDLNATNKVFPSVLSFINHSEILISVFMSVLLVFSVLLILNIQVVISCLVLWYGWGCLFNSNNLILNPSLAYIGWLLLALAYIQYKKDEICEEVYWGAGIMLAVGYSISGIAKGLSPSWIDGSAMLKIFSNPLARDYFLIDLLQHLPNSIFQVMTWSILLLEILYFPFFFFKSTRKVIWHFMVFLHFGILFFINFTDLTLGMLVVHTFAYDWEWHPKLKNLVLQKN